MLGQVDSQISEVLLAVCGCVLAERFSEVEGPLELAIVGIVVLIPDGLQVEIRASLVFVKIEVLSWPKSSHLALRSPHHAATAHRPSTPPM